MARRGALFLISIWIVFTVSLAIWWMIYGLKQIEKLAQAQHIIPEQILKSQRMLHWEGASLVLLLMLGGALLLYFSYRENKRHRQVQEFFATVTHELKTPLASLRLQVESLQEDLKGTPHVKLVERLLLDSTRLELQLENSLYLASLKGAEQLHLEAVEIGSVLRKFQDLWQERWPELKVNSKDQYYVSLDMRAFESVLKNLIQNAKVHGKATEIWLKTLRHGNSIQILVEDNGRGFSGDIKNASKLFHRHTTESGSGVGLYLANQLISHMGGRLNLETIEPRGFRAIATFNQVSGS